MDDEKTRICPVCGGSGFIFEDADAETDGFYDDDNLDDNPVSYGTDPMFECYYCNGTGIIHDNDDPFYDSLPEYSKPDINDAPGTHTSPVTVSSSSASPTLQNDGNADSSSNYSYEKENMRKNAKGCLEYLFTCLFSFIIVLAFYILLIAGTLYLLYLLLLYLIKS